MPSTATTTTNGGFPFADTQVMKEGFAQFRDLNEKMIQAVKDAGRVSIDAYEKGLQSLVEFEEKIAASTRLDWVTAMTENHTKFIQDMGNSYIKAAREVLK